MCVWVWREREGGSSLGTVSALMGMAALRHAGQASRQEAQVSTVATTVLVLSSSSAGSRLETQGFCVSVLRQKGFFFLDLSLCS